MTGQLFVVPAETPGRPLRPARPRAGRRPRGPLPRHPQVRAGSGCTGATRSAASWSPRSAALRSSRRSAPSRSIRPSTCATSGAGCDGGRAGSSRSCSTSRSSPGSATSTPTRRCGRRASIRSGRPARSTRPTSATCTTRSARILAEAIERRGSSIDDYTAPDGDGSMQERLQVYQRTGEPCPRCGRPIKRIVIGARSTHFCSWCQRLGAGGSEGSGGDPADDDRWAAPGRRSLDPAGGGGDPRPDAGRGGPRPRPGHGPSERNGPRRRAGRRRGPLPSRLGRRRSP